MLPDVHVGRYARLKRVVIDHGVRIPEGLVIGEDPVLDTKRFRVSEKGICLVTQEMINKLGL
jgi:glucose-1-phosphate adenylyltransferase